MAGYSIAAIPTEYNGRTYRSRLEARWAAFFDRLGWRAEYEPFDLGAWSPDFVLASGVLIEIKPATDFDGSTWDKMCAAVAERGLLSGDEPLPGLLLTTLAPRVHKGLVQIGVCAFPSYDASMSPSPAFLAWIACDDYPQFYVDIGTLIPGGWFLASIGEQRATDGVGNCYLPESYMDHTMRLWADATAAVQWRGPNEA